MCLLLIDYYIEIFAMVLWNKYVHKCNEMKDRLHITSTDFCYWTFDEKFKYL